jgi:signal transduction histidine kinase/PAS domain-containing protein
MSKHLRQSGGVSLMLGQLTSRRVNRDGPANAVESHRSAQAVIADLGMSVTSDQVASTLVGGGTQLMGAIGCALVAIDNGVEPRVVRTSGRVTSFDSEQHPIAEVELHPFRDAVRSGEAVWVTSRHQYELRYPELAKDEQASAWAVLPLTVNNIALGAIGWVFGQLDLMLDQELSLHDLARVGAQALYRASRYEIECSSRASAEAARDRLAAALDSLSQAVFTLDGRGLCFDANRSAERLLLLPRETLIGETIWHLLPDGVGNAMRKEFKRTMVSQTPRVTSVAYGRGRLTVSSTPTRGGVVITLADARGAPTPILAEVSALLEHTRDPVGTLSEVARASVPGLGDWCTVDCTNEHGWLERIAEVHVDSSLANQLHEIERIHAAQRRRIPRGLRDDHPVLISTRITNAGRAIGTTPRHVRALQQQLGATWIMAVPMHTHRHTLGILTFGGTGSGDRLDEPDLFVAQELGRRCGAFLEYAQLSRIARESAIAREEFVAATSHELRTPLSHIKGFVSTLRTTDTVWDAETRDDFLAEIEREADRLAKLIDNLLDMSRIDLRGLDRTALTETSARALIDGGLDRVRGSLGNHPLELDIAPDLPTVVVDASQIERVLSNLLENAAKYSPPDEPIGLIARLEHGALNVRIEDRGLGVPPEHVDRIFEPFFREPASGYPVKPGTGLGLAICRSIIRAHDGHIWVEQRPGGGAVLVFTLPVASHEHKV